MMLIIVNNWKLTNLMTKVKLCVFLQSAPIWTRKLNNQT